MGQAAAVVTDIHRTSSPTPAGGSPLRIVIVGHVDHGKSTLVGRLFHDTGSLPDGKLEAIEAMCERRGVPFEWAFLMDAFKSERDQNITIDTSQIWFSTAQRPYVIIDAPGHKEFLKNMVTGAAQADAALLLIAADEGVQEQSRRHGTLLSLLGVKQVHVVINKMDRVGFDETVYDSIVSEYRTFLQGLGVEASGFIPVSARDGDNIATRSAKSSWYTGPLVVEALDGFEAPAEPADADLRFAVQDVYRFDHRRILAGRVESGTVSAGDTLVFMPGGKRSKVASVERWAAEETDTASAGAVVGLTLEEQIFVERGHIGVHEPAAKRLAESTTVRARVFWMGKRPLEVGRPIKVKLATQETTARMSKVYRVLDASTLESREGAEVLARNDVADVELTAETALAFDDASRVPTTGRFVIVDDYELWGGGIITDAPYPADDGDDRLNEDDAADLIPLRVAERHLRNGHVGALFWLTGRGPRLEMARALERSLFSQGVQVVVLDSGALGGEIEANGPKPLLALSRHLVASGIVVIAVPSAAVVPHAPIVDPFFDVRVGRLTAASAEAITVDPETDGWNTSAAQLTQEAIGRLRQTQREWFYAI